MSKTASADGTQFHLDLPRNATIKALRYLRNGTLLAVATQKHGPSEELDDAHVVQVWEIGRPTLLCEWGAAGDSWNRVAIHPGGSALAISRDGELSLWTLPGGQQLWKVSPATLANDIAFSPNGRLLATVGPYGLRDNLAVVELPDADSGTELFSIRPGIQSCDDVAFSPDGTKLAVSGIHEDPSIGSIFVWTTDGRKLVDREHELGGQSDICFSPDGKFIVTCGSAIHFWDADTGDQVRDIKDGTGEVVG